MNDLKALKELLNTLTDEELEDGGICVEATIVTEEGEWNSFANVEEFYLDKYKDLNIVVELD